MTRRERILGVFDQLVADLVYYDRKGDEDLPPKSIQEAVKAREITVDEMVEEFRSWLTAALPGDAS